MSESVPSESIRVFLLIENRLLREALVRLLRKRPDLVIGSFQSNWLPPGFTLERVGELGFKTVLIGMDANEDHFMATVRAGVTGYLLKDASASDVVAAVRSVVRGEAVCPPQLCYTLFRFVAEASFNK